MKIRVDQERCSGHARCYATAPAVYEIDDNGYNTMGEVDVPPGLEEEARAGENACPERAITLIESQ